MRHSPFFVSHDPVAAILATNAEAIFDARWTSSCQNVGVVRFELGDLGDMGLFLG